MKNEAFDERKKRMKYPCNIDSPIRERSQASKQSSKSPLSKKPWRRIGGEKPKISRALFITEVDHKNE